MDTDAHASDEDRFRLVFAATYDDVVRFVQRRTHPDHAEDVAAEAFATAWRRVVDLPRSDDDARAWLFGIARNTLLNHQRGQQRQHAVAVRLAAASAHEAAGRWDPDVEGATARVDVRRAWSRLSPAHQEVLALTGWDGLTTVQAADVLGISPVAVRLRLSRARRALRAHVGPPPTTTSHDLERTTA